MPDYIPAIDLDNCPLNIEEISAAILAIPGAETFGGRANYSRAFALKNGGMVLLAMVPRMPNRINMTCAEGHPEEFGEVATALARLSMSLSPA
ncbi:hypothetical protein HY311_02785 [Candidatus Nomurabacteria bacterium]|nr:hypothetical protein [Candidatus Nomurabacteria bacterium]